MSTLQMNVHPTELITNSITMWEGDYYYRARNGELYMIREIDFPGTPLEIILLEYPKHSFIMENDSNFDRKFR